MQMIQKGNEGLVLVLIIGIVIVTSCQHGSKNPRSKDELVVSIATFADISLDSSPTSLGVPRPPYDESIDVVLSYGEMAVPILKEEILDRVEASRDARTIGLAFYCLNKLGDTSFKNEGLEIYYLLVENRSFFDQRDHADQIDYLFALDQCLRYSRGLDP